MKNKTLFIFRIALIMVITWVILNSLSFAEKEESFMSQGMLIGKGWLSMEPGHKVIYLAALRDGIVLFGSHAYFVAQDDYRLKEFISLNINQLDNKFTYSQLISKLDKFYRDESNCNIPIFKAYYYFCLEYMIEADDPFIGDFNLDWYLVRLRDESNKMYEKEKRNR